MAGGAARHEDLVPSRTHHWCLQSLSALAARYRRVTTRSARFYRLAGRDDLALRASWAHRNQPATGGGAPRRPPASPPGPGPSPPRRCNRWRPGLLTPRFRAAGAAGTGWPSAGRIVAEEAHLPGAPPWRGPDEYGGGRPAAQGEAPFAAPIQRRRAASPRQARRKVPPWPHGRGSWEGSLPWQPSPAKCGGPAGGYGLSANLLPA